MSIKPWKPRPADAVKVAQVMPRVLWIRVRDYALKVAAGGYAIGGKDRTRTADELRRYATDLAEQSAHLHKWADELEAKDATPPEWSRP